MRAIQPHDPEAMTFFQRLWNMSWFLIFLLVLLTAVGTGMLYSVADGSFQPWASRHLIRFGIGMVFLFAVALVDIRLWLRLAYVFYFGALALLVAVEITGTIGMGAQRWVSLGLFQLQPSEVMKIALVLALARYFHGRTVDEVGRLVFLLVPVAIR